MKQSLVRISPEQVETVIRLIRGEKVILDSDLSELYGVETRALIQAVKRNRKRFPKDFMFRLTGQEFTALRSQIVISKGRGGRRSSPYAFTEHGTIMAANVLNSERAVQASVQVVRGFIKLRQILASNAKLAATQFRFKFRNSQFAIRNSQFFPVFEAIRELMTPPRTKPKQIGFRPRSLKK